MDNYHSKTHESWPYLRQFSSATLSELYMLRCFGIVVSVLADILTHQSWCLCLSQHVRSEKHFTQDHVILGIESKTVHVIKPGHVGPQFTSISFTHTLTTVYLLLLVLLPLQELHVHVTMQLVLVQ